MNTCKNWIWDVCFENEPPTTEIELNDAQKAHVESLVVAERKIWQDKLTKHQADLEALQASANMSAADRQKLETSVEEMRSQLATKEQLAAQAAEKKERAYKVEKDKLTAERDLAVQRFTRSTIQNELTAAATHPEHEAFNPAQVLAILQPVARITEEPIAEGSEVMRVVVRVKLPSVDKNGKPVELDLTAAEAVKHLSEQEINFNLFKGKGAGGLGGKGKSGGTGEIPLSQVTDPAEYQRRRIAQEAERRKRK